MSAVAISRYSSSFLHARQSMRVEIWIYNIVLVPPYAEERCIAFNWQRFLIEWWCVDLRNGSQKYRVANMRFTFRRGTLLVLSGEIIWPSSHKVFKETVHRGQSLLDTILVFPCTFGTSFHMSLADTPRYSPNWLHMIKTLEKPCTAVLIQRDQHTISSRCSTVSKRYTIWRSISFETLSRRITCSCSFHVCPTPMTRVTQLMHLSSFLLAAWPSRNTCLL